jgi:hypothetical protein
MRTNQEMAAVIRAIVLEKWRGRCETEYRLTVYQRTTCFQNRTVYLGKETKERPRETLCEANRNSSHVAIFTSVF